MDTEALVDYMLGSPGPVLNTDMRRWGKSSETGIGGCGTRMDEYGSTASRLCPVPLAPSSLFIVFN